MQTKYWIRLALILIVFTSIVQIAGVVSPLWIYLESGNSTVGVGLYYRIGCDALTGNNCTETDFPQDLPFGYNSGATYDKDGWRAVTGLETASASFGIILTVLMIVYWIGFGFWKKMDNLNAAMVFTAILAWLPNLAGLVVFIVFYGRVIVRSPEVSPQSFPWSALMCLVALILFFIIMFLIHFRCRNRNYIQNAIPTSTDSKLALNPSTKNQLLRRYFTPIPYREDQRQALYSSMHDNDRNRLLANGIANGTIQNTGIENRGADHVYQRALEYNVTGTRQEVPVTTTVIQTNNLSSGTYFGNGATTTNTTLNQVNNGHIRGSYYDSNLSALVNNNTARNYGTEMVERTYMTRTLGHTTGGEQLDRRQNSYAQPEQEADNFVGREERVIGNRTTLDHSRAYDAFSEMDAETIIYTGHENFKPFSLNKEELFGIITDRRATTNEGQVSNYTFTREVKQTLPVVQEEQTVREVTVIEKSRGKPVEQIRRFISPADQQVGTEGIPKSTDYTVHTRTLLEKQGNDQLVLVPGYLSGKKYNDSHVYRPYSESSY